MAKLIKGSKAKCLRGLLQHASDIHSYSTRNSSAYRPVSAHTNYTLHHRNRKLQISRAPTKAKMQEPAYS